MTTEFKSDQKKKPRQSFLGRTNNLANRFQPCIIHKPNEHAREKVRCSHALHLLDAMQKSQPGMLAKPRPNAKAPLPANKKNSLFAKSHPGLRDRDAQPMKVESVQSYCFVLLASVKLVFCINRATEKEDLSLLLSSWVISLHSSEGYTEGSKQLLQLTRCFSMSSYWNLKLIQDWPGSKVLGSSGFAVC